MSDDEVYAEDAFAGDDQDSGSTSSWSATDSSDEEVDGSADEDVEDDGAELDTAGVATDQDASDVDEVDTGDVVTPTTDAVLGDPALEGVGSASPQYAITTDEGVLAAGTVAVDPSLVPAGLDLDPALYVDPSAVTVDPYADTVIGSPEIDQSYFQAQGPGNANCGPFSAAMAINAMTGSDLTGNEIAEFAKQQGWMTQDFVNGNPDWGYWSGLKPEHLEQLIDAYVGPTGGDAIPSNGTMETLAGHLAADHPVVVMVDSGELGTSGFDARDEDQSPNHFVTVTGIDYTQGQVYLNDPAQSAPVVMPLAQFEAAWKDSGNHMLEVNPGLSGTLDTTMTAPDTTVPAEDGPLVPLPSTATVPAAPSTSVADPTLSAVPPAPASIPPLAHGCCVLPMTLEWQVMDPVAAVGAPPVPPAVAAVGIPPNTMPTTSGLSSSVVPPMGRAAGG